MIETLKDDKIDEILMSDRTFIILFYSDKLIDLDRVMEMFEGFNEKLKDKIDMYKCAIDKETGKLSQYFQMNVLPGAVMMKNNKPYVNIAGPLSAEMYEEAIKNGIVKLMKEKKEVTSFSSNYSGGYKSL